jgi:hypothetical protein
VHRGIESKDLFFQTESSDFVMAVSREPQATPSLRNRRLPGLTFYFAERDRSQFHSGDLVRIDHLHAPDLLFKD